MVERVTGGSAYRLDELPALVGNEDALVCGIGCPDKFLTRVPAKVEERNTIRAIVDEGNVAGLFSVVLDVVRCVCGVDVA